MPRMKRGLTGILAGVLATLTIADAASAVSTPRGGAAFDAMIYRARAPVSRLGG